MSYYYAVFYDYFLTVLLQKCGGNHVLISSKACIVVLIRFYSLYIFYYWNSNKLKTMTDGVPNFIICRQVFIYLNDSWISYG